MHFPWYSQTGVVLWGDPFGNFSHTSEEDTFFEIARQDGLNFMTPATKDNPSMRHETGKAIVKNMDNGIPKLIVCPFGMPSFIEAMDGRCVMKSVKSPNGMVQRSEINKTNGYADIFEAAEYAWWGGGENHLIIENKSADQYPEKRNVTSRRSPFDRHRKNTKRFASRR